MNFPFLTDSLKTLQQSQSKEHLSNQKNKRYSWFQVILNCRYLHFRRIKLQEINLGNKNMTEEKNAIIKLF